MPLADHGAFWLVGCGNMGGAMLRGWIAAGLDPAQVVVIDPKAGDLPPATTVLAAPPSGGETPATVVLAIKPQLLDTVAPALAAAVGEATVVVSILAGVEIASIRRRLTRPRAVIRAMPNTPAAIGKGVVALFSDRFDAIGMERAADLMEPLGLVEWLDEEAAFDAVTAVSGSGPAFVFRFIEALAEAGASLGLPPQQAARLALATVEGSAALAAQAGESPAVLSERVASPGGTTRAGLDMLDEGDILTSPEPQPGPTCACIWSGSATTLRTVSGRTVGTTPSRNRARSRGSAALAPAVP